MEWGKWFYRCSHGTPLSQRRYNRQLKTMPFTSCSIVTANVQQLAVLYNGHSVPLVSNLNYYNKLRLMLKGRNG